MRKIPNLNYKVIAIVGAISFVVGIVITYVIFPPILKMALKFNLRLKPGSQMRKMYNELPFPLVFKVYLFNITNPDEVQVGGKPHVQEIGPYVYHEYKKRIDQVDDKVADTLEYMLINTFIFQPELSHGLNGNEVITVPHPVLLTLALSINVDRQPMLGLAAGAINAIFNNPKDIFWTGAAMDLMYNGIPIDCTSDDFNAKAVCSVFEGGEVKTIEPIEGKEDFYKFSFFNAGNGTPSGPWKVNRGVKDITKLGDVIEFDGEVEADAWSTDECNQYRGGDSTIFAPFKTKEEGLWAYEPAICRSMAATPTGKKTKYRGIPTRMYTLELGDIANDESQQCYCRSEEHCPVKGTIDLFPCIGAPIIGSKPHFLDADPSLLEKINGLNPNIPDHAVYIHYEIISGTPMSAAKRIQLNYEIVPIPEIEQLKHLQEMHLPILWIEEGADLNKTYVNLLKYQLFLALKFRALIKYSSMVLGLFAAVFGAVMHYMKSSQTPVTTIQVESPSSPTSAKPEADE